MNETTGYNQACLVAAKEKLTWPVEGRTADMALLRTIHLSPSSRNRCLSPAIPSPLQLMSKLSPALLVHGKRPGRIVTETAVPGPTPSRLFHVSDRVTKIRCLVCTGAEICVLHSALA
ncbi:hypothetical protein HPB50_017342 [Hyalomma asiaticum]|uniref:Uncharacterized protein n=1 Tax=Hyalomma asiaticum TaxID=266040 RepID=A0ACB7RSK2_HYAAI|nr:hypothetical protein HPB50_017342 [Hyalomma asiaticum]